MSSTTEPTLAPPGAGLPQPELAIARLMLRWQLRFTNRARSNARFVRERDGVLVLARSCPPAQAGQRVLIKRLPGLEDSSRFWSVYMTVEHLRIVNQGIGAVIAQLARGVVPERLTRTADVKPGKDIAGSVLEEFARGCDDLERTVSAVADLRSLVKHPHPWFGPLDAGEWYYMAAFHMGLHRVQIERILKELGSPEG